MWLQFKLKGSCNCPRLITRKYIDNKADNWSQYSESEAVMSLKLLSNKILIVFHVTQRSSLTVIR